MAYVGESVDKNGHLEVRLFYTEKERVLGLRQAGATYKGANTPQHMTLEEFVLKTTPPKKDGTEKN